MRQELIKMIAAIFIQTQRVSSTNIETGGYAINMTPDLIELILTLHNTERAIYNSVPLIWDPVMADKAAVHGEVCAFGHSSYDYRDYISAASPVGENGTASPIHHGENIAAAANEDFECKDIPSTLENSFESWNKESLRYDCPNNAPLADQGGVGHWTQIVWANTTHIGCALVCGCEDYMVNHGGTGWNKYLICEYGSAGNYVGERPFEEEYCDAFKSKPAGDQPEVYDATSSNVERITLKEKSILSFVLALFL